MAKKPEAMITTHVSVVKAVCAAVVEAGGKAVIADSPGGLYTEAILEKLYKTSGMYDIANELGVRLNFDLSSRETNVDINGHKRKISIIEPFFSCDKLINVCKLKTHVMSNYTGAVKNHYGLVPGITKAEYHYRFPDKKEFFSLVTDLCCFAAPVLSVMDAVTIMEGDGPSNGTPRELGLIMASENPFNLDLVGQTLIGFGNSDVLTSSFGEQYGLQCSLEELKIIGEDYRRYILKDVKLPKVSSTTFDKNIPAFLNTLIKKYLYPYPKFDSKKCASCGSCVTSCPAKVLKFRNKTPEITDKSRCIKCYCCHEMCPENAVRLRKLPKFLH